MSEMKQPCMLFINYPLFSDLSKISAKDYFGDPGCMLEAQVETYRKLGADGPVSPDFGTAVEASAFGGRVVYDNAGIPSIRPSDELNIEDLAKLPPADPYRDGLMAKFLEFLEYFNEHVPSDMHLTSGNTMAPLTAAATLRGISEFCMDLIDEPECVEQLLQTVTKTEIAFLKAQKEILGERFDRVFLSDDISSFLSADQFRNFVAPSYEAIYGAFPNVDRWLHNDGNALHIAEEVGKTSVEYWQIGKCVDMEEMFRRTGQKITLAGNLDPIRDLLNGAPDSVRERARREAERFWDTGRHICTTGGFLSFGTSVENIKAMMAGASSCD